MADPCPCLSVASSYGFLAGSWAAIAALWSGKPKETFYSCGPDLHLFNEAFKSGYRPITEEESDMPLIVSETKKEFSKAPEGLFEAVCSRVVDLGLVTTKYGQKHMVKIYWQIAEKEPGTEKRFTVGRRYTLSFAPKAKLRGDLEIWRGRKFTPDELKGFDLEKLIKVPCQVQIVHNLSDDGDTWANVQAVVPAARGSVALSVGEDYMGQPPLKVETTGNGEEPQPQPDSPTYDDDVPF